MALSCQSSSSRVRHVSKSVLLPYSAAQMYALVQAIEHYPAFLPWCSSTTVHEHSAGATEATIEMDFKGIRQRFTTVNVNTPESNIQLTLKNGPFSDLTGQWRFLQLGEMGCKVSFDINYAFSSRAMAAVIGAAFEKITDSLLDAFVSRADDVYGSAKAAAA